MGGDKRLVGANSHCRGFTVTKAAEAPMHSVTSQRASVGLGARIFKHEQNSSTGNISVMFS